MKISGHAADNLNKVTSFTAAINRDLLAVLSDEALYAFVGRQSGILFSELIHPDYADEFIKECATLTPGTSSRMLSYIKNHTGNYYLCDINVADNGRSLGDTEVLDVLVYIIDTIEYGYNYSLDNLNKYRTFLSIYHNYLMDYDPETDIFTIYLYLGSKSTPLIRCSIKDFYDKVRPKLSGKSDIDKFEIFYHNILDAKEDFDCAVNLPTLNDYSTMSTLCVTARVIYKRNKNPLVIGILRHSNADDDAMIPYYSTKEGRDSATGLLNKRAANEYTLDILKMHDNQKHYLIMIDIDNFKDINDSYGHLFGDEVILKVASTMNAMLDGRGIAGRFGGDEFYIFTTNIDNETSLRNLLSAIKKTIYYAYEERFRDLHVTLSIGVSMCPDDGTTYEELLKKADRCLYIAKEKGKNRFIIYDESKHGNISDSKERLQRRLGPLEKAEYLALVMADYCSDLIKNGSNAIPDILSSVVNNFELDGIRIYNGNSGALLTYNGTYKSLPEMTDIFRDEQFLSHYTDNHLNIVGSTTGYEVVHKQFSKEMVRCNILSTACYYFNNKNGEPIFIFYDLFNRTARWIESDKNYLLMLSRLLAEQF